MSVKASNSTTGLRSGVSHVCGGHLGPENGSKTETRRSLHKKRPVMTLEL
jgi:hypothetical protein